MKTAAKVLLIAGLALALVLFGSGVLLAASVARSGLVIVRVDEPGPQGTNLYLPLPAAVVHLGMDVLPWVMEEDLWAEVRTELGDWRPLAAGVLEAVEDAPDAVLVEVRNPRESVRIVKQGRSLEVRVQGDDGTVEISLPASLLGRIAREIA